MPAKSANYHLIEGVSRRVARGLLRDFLEVQKLQSSAKGADGYARRAWDRAEGRLKDALIEARTNYGWLGSFTEPRQGSDPTRKWIASVVDGASNFRRGIPHWAISIALEHKGEIVCALVYDAFRDEMFGAEKGLGSWLNGSRMRVSSRKRLSELVAACEIPVPDAGAGGQDLALLRMASRAAAVRVTGAPSLDLAYVASGSLDGYWTRRLDACEMAAGQLLVAESGGLVEPLHPPAGERAGSGLVAASGGIFSDFSRLVRGDGRA